MKEKKLTDEEIVKALERCIDESMGCVGCPYHGNSCRQMDIDVLDLIHRLQDENGKLKTLVSHFEQLEKQLSAEIERMKDEFKTDYRNSWKNKFFGVLEENRELQKQVDELKEERYYTEQDTAKEIIADMFKEIQGYENIDVILKRIAEHYGVEVK